MAAIEIPDSWLTAASDHTVSLGPESKNPTAVGDSKSDQENQDPNLLTPVVRKRLDRPVETYEWVDRLCVGGAQPHNKPSMPTIAAKVFSNVSSITNLVNQGITRSLADQMDAAYERSARKTQMKAASKRPLPSSSDDQTPVKKVKLHGAELFETIARHGYKMSDKLMAETGYAKSALYRMIKLLKKGYVPSTKLGAPFRIPPPVLQALAEEAQGKIGKHMSVSWCFNKSSLMYMTTAPERHHVQHTIYF